MILPMFKWTPYTFCIKEFPDINYFIWNQNGFVCGYIAIINSLYSKITALKRNETEKNSFTQHS